LLFQEGVLKISSVLLLNVVPLFSSVPRLHFGIFVCYLRGQNNQNKRQYTSHIPTKYKSKLTCSNRTTLNFKTQKFKKKSACQYKTIIK